ncbi:hypothetical protein BIY24_07440 [Halobacteriovorax marinus]|uniref:hypothetical protein n=1 Tax=Halobacteriovorax marinus TaxID=97084 RepID=UPI000BC2DB90|nr:hypothetical protein [Halobacteriovorax marinus]ATH07786.1 hypothetical protein BIY24_07440 [Halobacteriovorax marinus]
MNRIIGITLLLISMAGLTSCVSGDGRKGKPVIKSSNQGTGALGCEEDLFLLSSGDTCVTECPEGTFLANETELAEALAEETEQNIEISQNSAGVCLDDKITRPTDEVFITKDFCACKSGVPDIINNCESFCSSQSVETPTLFVNTTLGPNIELNEELGTLDRWCNAEISDGLTGPACFLEVYDGNGTTDLSVEIASGANSFKVNISSLALNKTYVATLKEKGSGSEAKSKSFQIRRIEYGTGDDNDEAPLKIMPISQYTCLTRAGTQVDAGNLYENAARLHYYFASNNNPPSLPPGDPFLFCHDVNRYGNDDSPLYDRLELIPQHMALWDLSDVRFADQNSDSRSDINETIQKRLLDDYGINKTINIFGLLTWPNMPNIEGNTPNLGYYMVPWIDPVSGRAFCPNQTNYNSDDKLFNILKEVIGVSTEGMYMAVKEAELLSNADNEPVLAPTDIMIIRENLLKKIWFYYENNQHYVPDEITATQKTIHFYWPADVNNPYIRKSTQKIYTIRRPTELNVGSDQTGIPTTVSPPDKRFGCMPALD